MKLKKIKNIFKKLSNGKLKICKKKKGKWKINISLKKIILLYIKKKKKKYIENKICKTYDIFNNILKKNKYIRYNSLSYARDGSYVGKNVILMPCFINVGAYIDDGCTIDTWATIGSCARIGKNVHISGGVGIGGVLEPINKLPVIIEDNCFIGARSEIVEGVIVKKNSVISMGVFIGSSTKIYNRINGKFYNYIPKNSVVVSGNLNYGLYSLYAVIIVKYRDKNTSKKIIMNKTIKKLNDN
ncbi:2,3,4,5-tetrahydropyridine-2,6-dicarboxylate N-succinyltransferase [Candidatus Vidania fulgoroideorum]